MPDKNFKEITDESLERSDKTLEHFHKANEMYESVKDMPRSPERDEALMQVLAKDDEAIAEAEKSIELTEEFIEKIDNKYNK